MSGSSSNAAAAVQQDTFVALDKLEEGVVAVVRVMVCRKWDSMNSFGKYLSTEYILSDSQGNAIQCSARSNIAHRFVSKLHEGCVYTLKNFSLVGNKDKFRVRKNDPYIISLEGYTVVKSLTCPADGFERFPFELTNFEDVEYNDSAYLIDVIGHVADVGKVKTTPAGSELLDCELVSASDSRMRVTLWAPLCYDFLKRKASSVVSYVVIFTGMNVKDFRGEPYLSSTFATTLFDSPDIPHISSFVALLGVTLNDPEKKLRSPTIVNGSIYQLLHGGRQQKGSRKKTATYHCRARITDIRTKDGWFYFSCGNGSCKKRVSRSGTHFMCLACNKVCEFPRTSYRLHVNVADSTGAVVLTMFDTVAGQLVGKSAVNLLEEIEDDGDESVLPEALLALTGTEHTFEVKTHTYYDQGAFESFTVNNLICPPAELVPTPKRNASVLADDSQLPKRSCARDDISCEDEINPISDTNAMSTAVDSSAEVVCPSIDG